MPSPMALLLNSVPISTEIIRLQKSTPPGFSFQRSKNIWTSELIFMSESQHWYLLWSLSLHPFRCSLQHPLTLTASLDASIRARPGHTQYISLTPYHTLENLYPRKSQALTGEPDKVVIKKKIRHFSNIGEIFVRINDRCSLTTESLKISCIIQLLTPNTWLWNTR